MPEKLRIAHEVPKPQELHGIRSLLRHFADTELGVDKEAKVTVL